jgi:hypothetical protein
MKKIVVLQDGSYAEFKDVRILEVEEEVFNMLQDGHPPDNMEVDEFIVLKEFEEDTCSFTQL